MRIINKNPLQYEVKCEKCGKKMVVTKIDCLPCPDIHPNGVQYKKKGSSGFSYKCEDCDNS